MTAKITHKIHNSATKDGLTAKVYRGDGAAMLAFNLDEKLTKDLAGFAVKRTAPDGKSAYLNNRLHFTSCVTTDTKAEEIGGHPTNEAPLQKFRWVDFPEEMMPGDFRYDVTAMLFDKGGKLKEGPTVRVDLEIEPKKIGDFEFGFTRGYLSSQAYTNLFKNATIRPAKKSLDFKTKAYAKQYEWLGYHARKMVFDFVDECLKDKRVTVDLFA